MTDAVDPRHLLTPDFIKGAEFTNADLSGLVLADKELYRCVFKGCTLGTARFEHVVFEACTFEDCDLSRATLPRSVSRGLTFTRCKLLGVHFNALSQRPELEFDGCDLRYAVFDGLHLRGTRFADSKLQDASFNGCDLVDADFTGCDLGAAVFTRCDLGGADFSTATDLLFDPAANRAKDAFISVDAAVQLARTHGLRVAGHDSAKKKSRR
jgi:uncharacterized protein YjbI with pentapeptide repeats